MTIVKVVGQPRWLQPMLVDCMLLSIPLGEMVSKVHLEAKRPKLAQNGLRRVVFEAFWSTLPALDL